MRRELLTCSNARRPKGSGQVTERFKKFSSENTEPVAVAQGVSPADFFNNSRPLQEICGRVRNSRGYSIAPRHMMPASLASHEEAITSPLSGWWLPAGLAAKENPQGSALRYNSCVATTSQSVRVKVLFFGRLKEVVGQSEESLDLANASTIEQLFALYSERVPEFRKYRSSVVASRNQEFASWDTVLHPGDEIAFLPPVSGG